MALSRKDDLPKDLSEKIDKVEKMIRPRLDEIDQQVLYNQQRVLNLFREHHVGEEDLVPALSRQCPAPTSHTQTILIPDPFFSPYHHSYSLVTAGSERGHWSIYTKETLQH